MEWEIRGELLGDGNPSWGETGREGELGWIDDTDFGASHLGEVDMI